MLLIASFWYIGYDCPPFTVLFENVSCVAGASLAMATYLVRKEAHVTINWYGGWHHGKKYVTGREREIERESKKEREKEKTVKHVGVLREWNKERI